MDIAAVGLDTFIENFISNVSESYRNWHPSCAHIELAWHLNDLHESLISQDVALVVVNRLRTYAADAIIAYAT